MDIMTMAMNLPAVDQLDFTHMMICTVARGVRSFPSTLDIYAGELVFTAFSGSHQDAIQMFVQTR